MTGLPPGPPPATANDNAVLPDWVKIEQSPYAGFFDSAHRQTFRALDQASDRPTQKLISAFEGAIERIACLNTDRQEERLDAFAEAWDLAVAAEAGQPPLSAAFHTCLHGYATLLEQDFCSHIADAANEYLSVQEIRAEVLRSRPQLVSRTDELRP